MNMDNDSDIFGVRMPQKNLQKISQDDYAAIDYSFSVAANNSSLDFAEVNLNLSLQNRYVAIYICTHFFQKKKVKMLT